MKQWILIGLLWVGAFLWAYMYIKPSPEITDQRVIDVVESGIINETKNVKTVYDPENAVYKDKFLMKVGFNGGPAFCMIYVEASYKFTTKSLQHQANESCEFIQQFMKGNRDFKGLSKNDINEKMVKYRPLFDGINTFHVLSNYK